MMSRLALLSLPFMQKAAFTLIVASATLSLLGVVVVVLTLTSIRFTLMHLGLLGGAIGVVLGGNSLVPAMLAITAGSLLFGPVAERTRLEVGQASALFMTGSLAATFLLIYKAKIPAMEAFSVFTGSVLMLRTADIVLTVALGLAVLLLTWGWYWEINLVLFDRELAAALGVRANALYYTLLTLLGLAISVSLRLVGALMVDALILLPAMAALPWARSLKQAFVLTSLFGVLSSSLGILASLLGDLPISGSVTLAGVAVLTVSHLARSAGRRRGRMLVAGVQKPGQEVVWK